ncbi:MAG: c-type cytochrome [Planctomycetaceae bacterium]
MMLLRVLPVSLLIFCILGLPVAVFSQEDEDAIIFPGLLGSYQEGGQEYFERIDPDIAFDWGTGTPDRRLPSRELFEVDWSGLIIIQQNIPMQFHAWVAGDVKVTIDGEVVLEGTTTEPGWVSGPAQSLQLGEQEIEVHYKRSATAGAIKLYWSSDTFALEPIPANLLLREEPSPEPYLIEEGREVTRAFRCFHCHAPPGNGTRTPELGAPPLNHVSETVDWNWLVAKIENPRHQNKASKMPDFGFDRTEAEAVAAYLWSKAKPAKLTEAPALPEPKAQKKKDEQTEQADPLLEGEQLVHTVGCLACHQVDELGTSELYSGPELTNSGAKRDIDWLYNWLDNPDKLYPGHQMPEVTLTDPEKTKIAMYLSALGETTEIDKNTETPEFSEEQIKQGRVLIEQAKCASCHDMNRIGSFSFYNSAPLMASQLTEPNSCVVPDKIPHQGTGPHYGEQVNVEAIKAFISTPLPVRRLDDRTESIAKGLSQHSEGERLLRRKNCLACHQRGNENGLKDLAGKIAAQVPGQEGLSESFVPPSLTAVGDKLRDDVLEKAIAGDQDRVRVDWLKVRMPKFKHSKEESSALLTYLKGHDRIPGNGPAVTDIPEIPQGSEEEWFLTGQALVGARGFSCIACHQIGDFKPKKVEPGARGTDLKGIGNRMRKEFFFRWVQSPIRVVIGMEMPSFNRPKEGVFEGHLPSQLASIWTALNHERLEIPTDPSVVEQYWAVEPGAPPRIVRDVFMLKNGKEEETIPRSFAVGFENGHSLLFDLAQPQLRLWTVGDFAQQRTSGKSWFSDMAGTPLGSFPSIPDFALTIDGDVLLPQPDGDTASRMVRYERTDSRVDLEYLVHFSLAGKTHDVRVIEKLESFTNDSTNGIKRSFEVSGLPGQSSLLVRLPDIQDGLGEAKVEFESNVKQETFQHEKLKGLAPSAERAAWLRLDANADHVSGGWTYLCKLKSPKLITTPAPLETIPPTPVTTVPGFTGTRLPLDRSIMPTAMTITPQGDLAFTSLKGDVYLARDTDGDGLEDKLILVEEGLAAPFGIYADGNQLLVSHKPEVLRLIDTNGDGRADEREVVATGWGYSEDYHDWTTGLIRDSQGYFYVALGSDYGQKNRIDFTRKWRGNVLRFDDSGNVESIATAFRFPTGMAVDSADRVLITDQQGVQNTFNEINFLQPGKAYGVPGWLDKEKENIATSPAIQIPHPWTRSVNGIFMLPDDYPVPELAGSGIGCELDSRFLIRFHVEEIAGEVQGSTFYFSEPNQVTSPENFLGPLSGCAGPDGSIYIGSIHDSGWGGGANTGEIVKLTPAGKLPNGIKQIHARKNGFEIKLMKPVDRALAADPSAYTISTYTRVWGGAYGTPDSGRHQVEVKQVSLADDGKSVYLELPELLPTYVYEINCNDLDPADEQPFWPATAHYTLNVIP